MNKADECVYPSNHDDNFAPEYGLSKREHFAAMAMQGILSRTMYSPSALARQSAEYADALLKELSK